jgi:cysteine desulfurase
MSNETRNTAVSLARATGPVRIYLDNAATTKTAPEVIAAMAPYFSESSANASSVHRDGVAAAKGVERARQIVAGRIHAAPDEIVFTSGGAEANNLALQGVFFAHGDRRRHVIVSAVEHATVLRAADWLESLGCRVTRLPVDGAGLIDPADVERALSAETILVSVMYANNEIGSIEPIADIGRLCREHGVAFHTDACQCLTLEPLDVAAQHLDLVSLNAHKLHGPKGVGALYVRDSVRLMPLFHGGGQERHRRAGTLNTPGIVGFGKAVEIAADADAAKMDRLRWAFWRNMEGTIPDVLLNGPHERRLCNNLNVSFRGVEGRRLVRELDEDGIAVGAGSACSSDTSDPSHVLRAIGRSDDDALAAVRFSLSRWTTAAELDEAAALLALAVRRLRNEPRGAAS